MDVCVASLHPFGRPARTAFLVPWRLQADNLDVRTRIGTLLLSTLLALAGAVLASGQASAPALAQSLAGLGGWTSLSTRELSGTVALGSSTSTVCIPAVTVSPWSVASSWGSSHAPQEWAARIAAAGITQVRGFDQDDSSRTTLADAGLARTGILQWSPVGQDFGFPMTDLDGWRAYVRSTVASYPDVRRWEVWNEPPNFTADTSTAHYATIVQIAYDTAKAVDPTVQIGLSAKATHIRWLGESILAGAAGHFDFITLHPYERAGMLATGGELGYMGIVPTVRAMLKATDPVQADVPVLFTEVGAPTQDGVHDFGSSVVDAQTQADLLVKVYTMGIAQGVETISWFDPWDGDYYPDYAETAPPYGLISKDGTPRPAYRALATLIDELGERPTYLGWFQPTADSYAFAFAGTKGTVLATWSTNSRRTTVDFGEPVSLITPASGGAFSVTTVRLTSSPVLVVADAGATASGWRAQALAHRDGPFGVSAQQGFLDGGRTVALSASGGEQGLSWINRPEAQTVDGRLAYPVTGRGSVPLVVDPEFSSWNRTAVTVTVVVRRLSSSTAGFNLRYDVDRPVSGSDWSGHASVGGWRTVPAEGWSTLSWTIPDASFVGMYGVNLTLDSDSSTYSNYAIASITVTKG